MGKGSGEWEGKGEQGKGKGKEIWEAKSCGKLVKRKRCFNENGQLKGKEKRRSIETKSQVDV